MNRDLDYVLNYMVKYTQDRYMKDSEPMLNHRDIELVLKHIWELEDKINKVIDFIENWLKYKKGNGSLEVSMLDLLYIKELLGDKIINSNKDN